MQPQMPTEADVVSATEGLRRTKAAVDGQIAALEAITMTILRFPSLSGTAAHFDSHDVDSDEMRRSGCPCGVFGLWGAIADFLRHYSAGIRETSNALDSQIQYNESVLASLRSSILLPHLRPRKTTPQ